MRIPAAFSGVAGNIRVVIALNEWAPKWRQDNWTKANGKPIANKELWQQVMRELEKHTYKAMLKE